MLAVFDACQEFEKPQFVADLLPVTLFPLGLDMLDEEANQFQVVPRIIMLGIDSEAVSIVADRHQ